MPNGLESALSFGDYGIGHSVSAEAALFGLYTNVDEGSVFIGILDIAVAIGGHAHDTAFRNVKHIIVDLERTFA